jgi:uncharacterized protein (TIGR03435 family)
MVCVRIRSITGGPAWIDANRFDIVVKATGAAPRDALMVMLKGWLADRFRLAARVEVREQPIYALVPSRSNGQPGPMLKPSAHQCAPGTVTNPCRMSGSIGAATGTMTAMGQTMADLATYLGQNAERPVVDRTGFAGRFDFELAWSAENLNAGLFTAVQEQLGLKLEPARGMVPMVVIDHADLPSPD